MLCSASAFLTNCWAIVEAPWRERPVTSAMNARAMPRMSTPGLVQNRLSSIDTIASCIVGEISPIELITTLFGGANSPIGRPWSSYR